jgi:hypothetical protein
MTEEVSASELDYGQVGDLWHMSLTSTATDPIRGVFDRQRNP